MYNACSINKGEVSMLIPEDDGTYSMGPADVICIFRLPTGRYHVAILEEKPLPGPVKPLNEAGFLRLQCTKHHTEGAETLQGAKEHVVELRKKFKIADANVVDDVSFDIDYPDCSTPVRNWIKEKIPLKNALGFPMPAV